MADDELLLIELDKLRQLINGLTGRLDDQENKLGDAFEQLGEIAEVIGVRDPSFALSPWWWPTMTPPQAREAWKTLTAWGDEIVIGRDDNGERTPEGEEWGLDELRYGDRVLRCWFAHPGIVDRLSALHWARRGDYRRHAPAHAPLEWQETWLPRTLNGMLTEFTERQCFGYCPYYNAGREGSERVKHDELGLRDRMSWTKADVERRAE